MRKHAIPRVALAGAGLFLLFHAATAYGAEKEQPKTDRYLSIEALCGDDMPFFKGDYIPPEKFVKTKLNEKDVYLSLEALCGEDPSRSYKLVIPEKYIRVKHDPQDLKLNLEKVLTDDPSFVKGQE